MQTTSEMLACIETSLTTNN